MSFQVSFTLSFSASHDCNTNKTVVSKFVGPVGQSDISYECPTKNVGVPDQMSDGNYKKKYPFDGWKEAE